MGGTVKSCFLGQPTTVVALVNHDAIKSSGQSRADVITSDAVTSLR